MTYPLLRRIYKIRAFRSVEKILNLKNWNALINMKTISKRIGLGKTD
jgi:hypothetical protein